jgi:cold shock protein
MSQSCRPKASVRGFEVQTGIVKWFNRRRGFVLIGPDSGCTDILLHVTAIEGSAPEELQAGQRVQFETVTKTAKPEIEELRPGTFHHWPR